MSSRNSTIAIVLMATFAMLAIASATELQQPHIASSSSGGKAANRKMLQLPGGQNLMQGLTNAMGSQAPQMLGNMLNNRNGGARPLGGNNNAAGGLGNLMNPQAMQGAMTAAQRMMGMGRRLQQSFGSRASQMAANAVRSQAATSQAITEAVESGASMRATRRAGNTGSLMTWAAAQNDQRTFDAAERLAYYG